MRSIKQTDITGNTIAIYEDSYEASEKTGYTRQQITRRAGRNRTIDGYKFDYIEDRERLYSHDGPVPKYISNFS